MNAAAHRLRLDGMLRDLGARDDGKDDDGDPRLATGSTDIRASAAAGIRKAIDEHVAPMDRDPDAQGAPRVPMGADAQPPRRESITIGELVDTAAHSGFGFLVAVLSLIAIPFFGLSTPFGLAIALVGVQLMVGRARPWLPKSFRARALKMTMLDRILALVNRRLRWLAASTRKRWQPLVTPKLAGLGVVLLALGLALPLPIPGSNMIFIVPLLAYAIGLLEADGLWILLAHVATLVNMALLIAFGATVLAVLQGAWHWLF